MSIGPTQSILLVIRPNGQIPTTGLEHENVTSFRERVVGDAFQILD